MFVIALVTAGLQGHSPLVLITASVATLICGSNQTKFFPLNHGCQMAKAQFSDCEPLALLA